MEWGTSYVDEHFAGFVANVSEDLFPFQPQAILACQRFCASVRGCLHFALDLQTRLCSLTGRGATQRYPAIGSLAGPPQACRSSLQATAQIIMFKFLSVPGGIIAAGRARGVLAMVAACVITVGIASAAMLIVFRAGGVRRVPWTSYAALARQEAQMDTFARPWPTFPAVMSL